MSRNNFYGLRLFVFQLRIGFVPFLVRNKGSYRKEEGVNGDVKLTTFLLPIYFVFFFILFKAKSGKGGNDGYQALSFCLI